MPGPPGLRESAAVPGGSDGKQETQDNITLSGQVRTWAGHDAVISAAWTANGVIDVRDELHVTG